PDRGARGQSVGAESVFGARGDRVGVRRVRLRFGYSILAGIPLRGGTRLSEVRFAQSGRQRLGSRAPSVPRTGLSVPFDEEARRPKGCCRSRLGRLISRLTESR